MESVEVKTVKRGPLTYHLEYTPNHYESPNEVYEVFKIIPAHMPGKTVMIGDTPLLNTNYTVDERASELDITRDEAEEEIKKEAKHYYHGHTLHVQGYVTAPTGDVLAEDSIGTDFSHVYYDSEEEAAKEVAETYNFEEKLFEEVVEGLDEAINRKKAQLRLLEDIQVDLTTAQVA